MTIDPVATGQRAVYPSLEGKRIVVTGGGSGIGAGLVEAFARQGAEVHFIDLLKQESEQLVDSLGRVAIRPTFHACDLRDVAAIATCFAAIGPVNVLVNNAGNDDRHTLDDVTSDYFEDRIAVNLRHLMFCAKAVVPAMKAAGGGAIINFGSVSWHLGLPGLVLYETAKAAILGMTRGLARELGELGIRVTCVTPGNVRTPRQEQWYSREAEAQLVEQQCLKTRIEPRDVAALVLFLASDDGRMCTGQDYWIDAGWR